MSHKKWWWIGGLIIIITLVVISLKIINKKTPTYKTVSVEKGRIVETVEIAGQLIPDHVVQVKSPLSGQIEQILVKPGQKLHKGEKLAVIKPSPTPEQIVSARAEVNQAKTQLAFAQKEYMRAKKLRLQDAMTQAQLDAAFKARELAQIGLSTAKQKLELIMDGKSNIRGREVQNVVVSPIEGQVLTKLVDVGDSVVPVTAYQAGTPLFTLADMKHLIFKGDVSQVDVGKLALNQAAKITVAALPDVYLHGKITNIALLPSSKQTNALSVSTTDLFESQSNVQNGFAVKVGNLTLPAHRHFRAGLQATATVILRDLKNVLVLPQKVLHFEENGAPYVEVVRDSSQYPQVQPVKLGISDNIRVQVLEGLQEGEKVVEASSE